MEYQGIILELLNRIQRLEEKVQFLEQKIENMAMNNEHSDLGAMRNVDKNAPVLYQKMTEEMIMACYAGGKRFVAGEYASDIADGIVKKTGMNKNSAVMYIHAVGGMLEGTIYKRAINFKAMKTYFDLILKEYGKEGLRKAIKATRLHVEYRRGFGHMVDSIEDVCDEYELRL